MFDKRQNIGFFCLFVFVKCFDKRRRKLFLQTTQHGTQKYSKTMKGDLGYKSKQLCNEMDFPVWSTELEVFMCLTFNWAYFAAELYHQGGFTFHSLILRSPPTLPANANTSHLNVYDYFKQVNMPNWSSRYEQARDLLIICHSENQHFVNTKWNSTVFY